MSGYARPMRILMVGIGVVGQSVAQMLLSHSLELRDLYGLHPRVVAMVDGGGAAISEKGLDLTEALRIKRKRQSVATLVGAGRPGLSTKDVVDEVGADLMIEATPTNVEDGEPGLTNLKTALSTGMHVVTVNKGPLALELPSLLDMARKRHVSLLFSGAVGGGLPILAYAKNCLYGERILGIRGVLNGTTNYVLWKMEKEKKSIGEAYAEARSLGYAERDPSNDLDGIDTACKLVIIANWVLNFKVRLQDVQITGIRKVSLRQITEAEKANSAIRLIGSIEKKLKVGPEIVAKDNPLCVDSNLNAIAFATEYTGQHFIIGKGAGGCETAASVIRDLIALAKLNEGLKYSTVRFSSIYGHEAETYD